MKNKAPKDALAWYCPRGHNAFDSNQYSCDDPPECGSCGAPMTTDSTSFYDFHEALEDAGISEVTAKAKKMKMWSAH